jgi:hypothetical protein
MGFFERQNQVSAFYTFENKNRIAAAIKASGGALFLYNFEIKLRLGGDVITLLL